MPLHDKGCQQLANANDNPTALAPEEGTHQESIKIEEGKTQLPPLIIELSGKKLFAKCSSKYTQYFKM